MQLVMKNALEEKLSANASDKTKTRPDLPPANVAELKAKMYYESCMDSDGTVEALSGRPVLKLIKDHFESWPLLEQGKASPHVNQVPNLDHRHHHHYRIAENLT